MYDPASYWDAKVRRSGGDPMRAVGMDNPLENVCIDRVQHSLVPDAIRRFALPSFWPGDRVLDFGCGTGRWLSWLISCGYDYSGVDISPEEIHLAQKLHPGVKVSTFDGLHTGFKDAAFKLVLSVGVIHHNQYVDQDTIITELVRVLAPGGHLILFEGIGPAAREGSVEYPRPLSKWREPLEAAGLVHLDTRKARYWILRSLYSDFLEGRMSRLGWHSTALPKLALRADAVVDPVLLPLLPDWYVTRALMVFHKPLVTAKENA